MSSRTSSADHSWFGDQPRSALHPFVDGMSATIPVGAGGARWAETGLVSLRTETEPIVQQQPIEKRYRNRGVVCCVSGVVKVISVLMAATVLPSPTGIAVGWFR